MESIDERYRIQQILLTVLGLWPYSNTMYKRIQRIFFTLVLSFSIFLQIGKLITIASNLEDFLEVLSFAVPCLVVTLKYSTFCIKSEDIKKILSLINHHWNSIKCKEELKILQQYYNISNILTTMIAAVFYSGLVLFLMVQILPKFLDAVIPLNESRPLKLLGLATFLFDQEQYFVLIFVHMTIALLVEATTIVATETISLVYVQHICGLFKITSLRMKHAFDCEIQISVSEKYKIYYTNIIKAVVIHNKAIELFEVLLYGFEMSYFILIILGVSSLSINMFRIFQAGLKKEIEEVFIAGILIIIHFIYIFMNNFMAQRITNHSNDIFYKICELPWYSVPIPLQKLLQFIIQRSMKSCKLTVYIFTGSLAFFASIVSSSLSYFTVFVSLQ